MLGIVLKILSIVGIVLLAGLGLVLVFLLLLLFFPFTYRVLGSKDENGLRLTARVNWLFGLFRVRFCYPEPGHLTAKVLCFSLCDLKIPPEKREDSEGQQKAGTAKEASGKKKFFGKKANKTGHPANEEQQTLERPLSGEEALSGKESSLSKEEPSGEEIRNPKEGNPLASAMDRADAEAADSRTGEDSPPESNPGLIGKILQKFQNIKYTICNIYDKMKEIWDNISYYLRLLQEENTKKLAAHVLSRTCKILKSIRPRRISVQFHFGMDTPDTTGYLYGVYCILSAALGPGVEVTPDFEQKRLEAKFDIGGHIVVWVFVINGLKLLLDRKLHLFLKKIMASRKKPENVPAG